MSYTICHIVSIIVQYCTIILYSTPHIGIRIRIRIIGISVSANQFFFTVFFFHPIFPRSPGGKISSRTVRGKFANSSRTVRTFPPGELSSNHQTQFAKSCRSRTFAEQFANGEFVCNDNTQPCELLYELGFATSARCELLRELVANTWFVCIGHGSPWFA